MDDFIEIAQFNSRNDLDKFLHTFQYPTIQTNNNLVNCSTCKMANQPHNHSMRAMYRKCNCQCKKKHAKSTRKDFERISNNKYSVKNARYADSEGIICTKTKQCSCRHFINFGICAELIAAEKFLGIDLENRNLEEMLELQHQFAIKVKRGRHRLAEKALQNSPVKAEPKSSKKTPVEPESGPKSSKKTPIEQPMLPKRGRPFGSTKNKQAEVAKSSKTIESEQSDARRSARNSKKTA